MSKEILEVKRYNTSNTDDILIDHTVVLPTYNRSDVLIRNLETINKCIPTPVDVIVVDGSSSDKKVFLDIEIWLAENDLLFNLVYIDSPKGLTLQRHVGFLYAKTNIISYLDDDAFPESDYFGIISCFFDNPANNSYGGVTGMDVLCKKKKITGTWKLRQNLGLYPKDALPFKYFGNGSSFPPFYDVFQEELNKEYDIDCLQGCCMSFRKDALHVAGGFSSFFEGYSQGEDMEVSLRVKNHGFKLRYLPSAKVEHIAVQLSRPNPYHRGFMRVYNKYQIFTNLTQNKTFRNYFLFWVDIQIYFLLVLRNVFFCKDIKFNFRTILGIIKGSFKVIFTPKVNWAGKLGEFEYSFLEN